MSHFSLLWDIVKMKFVKYQVVRSSKRNDRGKIQMVTFFFFIIIE